MITIGPRFSILGAESGLRRQWGQYRNEKQEGEPIIEVLALGFDLLIAGPIPVWAR